MSGAIQPTDYILISRSGTEYKAPVSELPFDAGGGDNSEVFVEKDGDEMLGPLLLSTPQPSDDLEAAPKVYVDNSIKGTESLLSNMLPLAGGTMSGYITLHAAPTDNSHAATKAYVDGKLTNDFRTLPTL